MRAAADTTRRAATEAVPPPIPAIAPQPQKPDVGFSGA